MMTGELPDPGHHQSEYDTIPSALAQSQVKRMALELVHNIVGDSLEEVLDNVITGNIVQRLPDLSELTQLQVAGGQI